MSRMIEAMPERFRTFDVCVAALHENWFVMHDIPEPIRDEVVKAVVGPPVTLTQQERALLERPTKLRLFLYFIGRRPFITVLLRTFASVAVLGLLIWLALQAR